MNTYYIFLSPIAEEPDLSKLVVSNVTSDRFSLTWRTGEKEFDKFIVEVRESALPSQAVGRALPGDVRSTVMTGLKASTNYSIKVYASDSRGQNSQPLFAIATTGITLTPFHVTRCSQDHVTEKLSSLFRGRPTLGAHNRFLCKPT